MIPQKLIRAAATWALGLVLILSITALAERMAPDQKQPLERDLQPQGATVPVAAGNLQMQPAPLVPQLVGVNLGSEIEPNNTFTTATALGANPEGKIKGACLGIVTPYATDPDWFSFTTTAAGSKIYAATINSAAGSQDTILAVIASDGTTILESDDQDGSFGGSSSSIAGTVLATPGTYYLRVTNFSTTSPIVPYDLYFAVRSGAPTAETEPNNNGTPQTLPASQYVSGVIDPVADSDTFSFSANAGDTVFISQDLDPERDVTNFNGRIGLGLFGTPPNFLVTSDAGTVDTIDSEAIAMTVKTTGTYTVYVDSQTAGGGGPTATYAFSVTTIPASPSGTCTTYTNSTSTPIADLALTSSTIVIPDSKIIRSLRVTTDITHANFPDLDVHLRSPATSNNDNGLFSDVGVATQTGAQNLTLNDEVAALPLIFTVNNGPLYRAEPAYRLDWFKGENSLGTWTLDIRDDLTANTGTLNSWSLEVCEEPALTGTVVYSQDFEATDGGYTHTGTLDEWERGTPATVAQLVTSPFIAQFNSCASGVNCWKTDLDNTYELSSSQDLVSPSISLVGVSGPVTLYWQQRYQMESAAFDQIFVKVTEVGNPAHTRIVWNSDTQTMSEAVGSGASLANTPESAGWGRASGNISDFAGQTITVTFHLESDNSVNLGGWAIDDVSIRGTVASSPTPTPTVTPATPTPTPSPSVTPSPSATPTPGGNFYASGSLTITDPTFVNPNGSTSGTGRQFFDVFQFTPTVTGNYTIEMSSLNTNPAGNSNALDTFLRIYAGAFNPAAPGAGLAFDDDFTGTLTVLPGPFTSAGLTTAATGFTGTQPSSRLPDTGTLNLVAGTQYFLVLTSFRSTDFANTGTTAGPTGPYWFGIGPGTIIPTGPTPTPSASASATPATPTPTPSVTATPSGTPSPSATPTPGACSSINGGLNPQVLTESGVAAPAGFFWSEVQHDVGNTTVSNTNAGYADTQGTNRLADNFTLGGPCTIQSVTFYGYLTGAPATPSPFTAYTLQIWNGRPGDPGAVVVFGDTTTNRLASSVDSTYFRIFNTVVPPPGTAQGTTRKIWRNTVTVGATLPAGTYWVDWASTVTGAANHFAPAKTIQGARGAAGDNARQFATGAWTDVVDAGFPVTGAPVPQDFPFEVNGTGGGTPPPSPSPGTPTPTPSATATPSPCGVSTFSNTTAITIPAGAPGVTQGPAAPYPSDIAVAGTTGTVTKVTVNLNALTSTFPGDLDLLLVGPGGQSAVIMSDAGGGTDVTNINLTLDDAAAAAMSATTLAAGTFRPTNLVGLAPEPDTWSAPAPAPPSGGTSALSVFNGTSANGTWSLYIVDDANLDFHALNGGWALNISTTSGVCATPTPGTPTPTPSCPPAANVIQDGTFEAGTPWSAWTVQTSTNFGTPMCDAGCGTGGGTAGGFGGSANWAWFGGTASAETATTGQSVVIASGGPASLTFQLWIGAVATPFTDVLNVRVDGTLVGSFVEPATAELGYTLRTIDVSAFANGASHAILFEYVGPGGAVSNFSVDNVSLVTGGACPTPTPSATPTIPPPTPTPTASASPTATVPATPSPTATVSGTPSPVPTVGASPSASPAVTSQAVNLSTRMRVQTGDRVGIAGFIVRGGPKTVLLRAIGPSLTRYKIEDVLADPVLELHGPTGFTTIINDNWRVPNGPAIQATGIPPTNDLESAILATLNPGAYTGIIKGVGNTSGVGLVEVYDLSPASGRLANISTRAFVATGDNVVIAGFVLDGPSDGSAAPDSLVLRGIGPSLTAAGVTSVMADPTLELRDSNGTLLISNNDWQDNAAQAALITAAGLAPSNNLESAIAATLPPGLYTALLAGLNNTSGNGLVEVYDLGAQGGGPVPTPTPTPPGGTPTPSIAPSPGASPSPGVSPSPTPPGATVTPTPPAASPTPSPTTCTESFDTVTAPALPSGWTASNEGTPPDNGVVWVTNTLTPDSAPNSAFIDDQNGVSDKYMVTRNIVINSAAPKITFRNFYSTEYDPPPTEEFWDGYVLEISINGGAFADITAPAADGGGAGTFVTGGYTGEINGIASNPLAGRQAWSGENTGYISTEINLGAHLNGQTVKLRFRMGSDLFSPGDGVHVDGLTINGGSCPP